MTRLAYLSCTVLALSACAGDPLDDGEDIAGWANSASALGAFTVGSDPILLAEGLYAFEDPSCPIVEDNGEILTITGGCTDSGERNWIGSAEVERVGETDFVLSMMAYGTDVFGSRGTTGLFSVTQLESGLRQFDVEVIRDDIVYSEMAYTGTVEGEYGQATLWNGRGRIFRDGFDLDKGIVDAITFNQARDGSICDSESLSGTTTMTSKAHDVVIAYDGAEDCDPEATVRWSRDGDDQGTISGVTCSAASGMTGGPFVLVGVALSILLASRRRRSSEV